MISEDLYVNWQAPLYLASTGSMKLLDIPLNARVQLKKTEPQDGRWFVLYKELFGWVPDKYIEYYVTNYPENVVDMQGLQTPDPYDLAQFAMVNKIKQVNLCGELCLCNILEVGLKDFLDVWGVRDVPLWKRIFGAGKARGTGPSELIELLNGCSVLKSTVIDQKTYPRWTPRTLYDMLQKYQVIASVNINNDGSLRGAGILHWVVIEKITLEKRGALVEFYNPASNDIEVCDWERFLASARVPYGCLVER